jgi:Zn-dependent protease/predicted transcriptional regulator
MFGHSWRVGRVGGVEIRIDASWSVIALLISYSLFLGFTDAFPRLSDPAAIALAVGATIVFFGSVLAHEMTHALVARRMGMRVEGITLFIFGGATRADVESHSARQEFLVSVVGPLSSLALGAVFWLVALSGDRLLTHPIAGAIGYLGWVNLLLAGFNLLPGYPLDGGRVLHSAVWGATGDVARATRVATLVGKGLGFAMIALGFLLVFGGAIISGVWLAAIGWFLAQSARASYEQFELRRLLTGVEADRVMEQPLQTVPGDTTLRDAVDRYLVRHDQSVFPVDERGRTVGVLTLASVRDVPTRDWEQVRVHDSMLPVDPGIVVGPHAQMDEVLARLREGTGYVLVESEGKLVGVVTVEDLGRWMRRRRALSA